MRRSRSYLLEDPQVLLSEEQRLQAQATALLAAEVEQLQQHGLSDGMVVLDVGCGNAAFLAGVQRLLPGIRPVGVDRNDKLLAAASKLCPQGQFHQGDVLDLVALRSLLVSAKPDLIYSRFVLQHMTAAEIELALAALQRFKPADTRVVLIDVNDREMTHSPHCAAIDRLLAAKMARQQANGGDRTIGKRLGDLLQNRGYDRIQTSVVVLGPRLTGWTVATQVVLPVLRSGVEEPYSAGERRDLQECDAWFAAASTDPAFDMSCPLYFASGA